MPGRVGACWGLRFLSGSWEVAASRILLSFFRPPKMPDQRSPARTARTARALQWVWLPGCLGPFSGQRYLVTFAFLPLPQAGFRWLRRVLLRVISLGGAGGSAGFSWFPAGCYREDLAGHFKAESEVFQGVPWAVPQDLT